MIYTIAIVGVIVVLTALYGFKKRYKKTRNNRDFKEVWRDLLIKHVAFYDFLDAEGRTKFEIRILEFWDNYRITGIKTSLSDLDRLLVASSAIIPTFGLPHWRYRYLHEVLVYPDAFQTDFEINGNKADARILGMVGTGSLDGVLFLSKKSLLHGFENDVDKVNVGIHEFVHLIDREDGEIDGIPEILIKHSYVLPWLKMVQQHLTEINHHHSDIRYYAGTSSAEFFTVVSEYFFENPEALKRKHPELYQVLTEMFNQDPAEFKKGKHRSIIGRNSPCPCGSKKKFKYCCGKEHFTV